MDGKRPASAAGSSLLLALLLAFLALLLIACDSGEGLTVRGQVVEFTPRSFSELEHLKIRDDEGREFVFETDGFVGFTPSHVGEHQLLGQSLLVTYEKRGGRLVATMLED